MVVYDDREKHREQFPREGDCPVNPDSLIKEKQAEAYIHLHECQRPKMLQRLKNKQLPQRTRQRKLRKRTNNIRMRPNKLQRALQLRPAMRRMQHRDVRQRKDRDERGEESAEDVYPEHHLLAGDFEPREDLVLGGVRRAVDGEVDQQVRDAYQLRRPAQLATILGLS